MRRLLSRAILLAVGASDAKMEEGSMRCDANVSVHKPGEPYGTRCEIKNVNSIRSLGRAIEYEARRQIDMIENGETVRQETRHWDENDSRTHTLRTKEDADDYRYFLEPDLVPLDPPPEWIDAVRAKLPMLPAEALSPKLIAAGRESFGNWILVEHRPGQVLARAWADMSEDQRRRSVHVLGRALAAIHATELPSEASWPMTPPTSPERLAQYPHYCDARRTLQFIEAARQLPFVDGKVLDDARQYGREELGGEADRARKRGAGVVRGVRQHGHHDRVAEAERDVLRDVARHEVVAAVRVLRPALLGAAGGHERHGLAMLDGVLDLPCGRAPPRGACRGLERSGRRTSAGGRTLAARPLPFPGRSQLPAQGGRAAQGWGMTRPRQTTGALRRRSQAAATLHHTKAARASG